MIGELAAIGAAITWAIAPILYRNALEGTNPISANIVRCISNGIVLFMLLISLGYASIMTSLPTWVIGLTVVSGVIGLGLGDTLYMAGLKTLGVSRAVPLASTYPLFGLIWAIFFLGEPLSFFAIAGAIAIVAGIWLLSRHNAVDSASLTRKQLLFGVGASLSTAVIWSVSLTLMDVIVASGLNGLGDNFAIITVRISSLALLFAAFSPFIDRGRGFLKIGKKGIILLCVGGLVANGLGWLLMNYSFLYLPESQAIPMSSTSPLFAALAGFTLFHEKATTPKILGAVIIVVGIFLVFIV